MFAWIWWMIVGGRGQPVFKDLGESRKRLHESKPWLIAIEGTGRLSGG
jgi:hypothetical protein